MGVGGDAGVRKGIDGDAGVCGDRGVDAEC